MKELIGSKTFSLQDQQKFAELSGDFNPLHINPIYARRTLFGNALVHGVHLGLWSCDCFLRSYQLEHFFIETIEARFLKPVIIDDCVECFLTENDGSQIILSIEQKRNITSIIKIKFNERWFWETDLPDEEFERIPKDHTVKQISAMNGEVKVSLNNILFKEHFPTAFDRINNLQAAYLLSLTRLVGMDCPGLNSIFGEFRVNFLEKHQREDTWKFSVERYDERFSLVRILLDSQNMNGFIHAFIRPSLQEQPKIKEIAKATDPSQFAQINALIIGGSRGIGEVITKVLVAGGANVCFTYYLGESEAREIEKDINEYGIIVKCFQYQSSKPQILTDKLLEIEFSPTHIFYMPTPSIFSSKEPNFDVGAFELFQSVYINQYIQLVKQLYTIYGEKNISFFWPSSEAVEELPPAMLEYAVTKEMGEVLSKHLQVSFPFFSFSHLRLGRIRTDQTTNVQNIESDEAISAVMEILRLLNV